MKNPDDLRPEPESPTPENYGYVVVQAPNGKWCVADPQDDADGFYVECDTEEEARREWREWQEP